MLSACSFANSAQRQPPPAESAAHQAANSSGTPAAEPARAAGNLPPSSATVTPDLPVILAFGDSLTAGQGVPREWSYPAQLQQLLDNQGFHYRVVNAGVSGDTSAGGLSRVDRLLAQHRPAVVILELGANDGLRGLPVAQMRTNLDRTLVAIRAAGARVVLAGMEAPPNMGPDYTAAYRKVFPELANHHDAALIPFFLEGVAAKPDLNLADGIHPNARGYEIVTASVFRVLAPLLKA